MAVLALRDMESRLNSLLLSGETDSEKELRRQRYMERERKRELSKAWVEEYKTKLNAFYANEVNEFPEFLNSPGYEFTSADAMYAWVECTLARMALFYADSQNTVPFPSLLPPMCVLGNENDVKFIASLLNLYYRDGMPWPGYWAFSPDQMHVFGTPEVAEIDFRKKRDEGTRLYVRENYLETFSFSFRSVQETVRRGGHCYVANDVIHLYLNTNEFNTLEITYINVRPCMQRRGLFTIFLYIIIEACLASGRRVLGVSKAIQFTQTLFAEYGFAKKNEEDRGKVDMEINGSEAMERVLDKLRQKKAVQQLIQNPDSWYYIDPRSFPTAAELRNPAYVQALFPKPNTQPPRYAPGQLPGSD
jgi:hypothetical protein